MIQHVGRPVFALLFYDFVVVIAYRVLHWTWIGSQHIPLVLYGSAIGILVGFRNNSAYARWWEGRQLWGQVVNNSRSLGRQVMATLRPKNGHDPIELAELGEMQKRLLYLQIGFSHALRQHLRRLPPWDDLQRVLPPAELELLRNEGNVPLALQGRMSFLMRECQAKGWVDALAWQAMDRNLDDLADAQGGCERIKNTPMPTQYDYFPQLFVQLYCLMLPIGMVANLGWITPLGSTLVGFIFLAVDKIGRELEDPFHHTVFDVPMTAITKGIEIDLRQLLGERELPEPEKPVRGVLW
jgi:putative membrane protein